MRLYNLKITFWLAFLSLLLVPELFGRLHLFFLAPYLVITLYKCSRFASICRAVGCGIIVDLLSSTPLFGFTPLNYALTMLLLSTQKRNFFEDKLSTIPLMTAFFSIVSTLIAVIFAFFFGQSISLSWGWFVSDLIGMPLLDGIYGLLLFSLPFQITYQVRRLWRYRIRKNS